MSQDPMKNKQKKSPRIKWQLFFGYSNEHRDSEFEKNHAKFGQDFD